MGFPVHLLTIPSILPSPILCLSPPSRSLSGDGDKAPQQWAACRLPVACQPAAPCLEKLLERPGQWGEKQSGWVPHPHSQPNSGSQACSWVQAGAQRVEGDGASGRGMGTSKQTSAGFVG